jgi:Resolvase, N terminal domain
MQRPTRVAIYVRISTMEQDPEAQLFALRTYAAPRGFEVYREYTGPIRAVVLVGLMKSIS